tara:strand:- start:130 stop:726 length:597 start_codon:yes stop_codon:yes gene_type:complete
MACNATKVPNTVPVTSWWDLLPDDLQETILQMVKEMLQKKEGYRKGMNVANQFIRFKYSIPRSAMVKIGAECKEGGWLNEVATRLVANGDYKSLNGFILARQSAVASEQWLVKMTPEQRKPFVQQWYEDSVAAKQKAGKKAVRMNDYQLLAKATDVRQSLSEWEYKRQRLLEKLGSEQVLERYLTLPTVNDDSQPMGE